MVKKKPDNVKFLIHAVLWTFLISALIQAYVPLLLPKIPEETMQTVINRMAELSPQAVTEKLTVAEKPVLLFVYASWCSYCREALPELLKIQEEGKMKGVEPIFLSIDEDRRKLAAYLIRSHYTERFTSYVMAPDQKGWPLIRALEGLSSHYNGGLPYIALFRNGKPDFELSGGPDETDLQNLLHRVTLSINP
jgi:thiol-disulfide isomerase/thioredoxin